MSVVTCSCYSVTCWTLLLRVSFVERCCYTVNYCHCCWSVGRLGWCYGVTFCVFIWKCQLRCVSFFESSCYIVNYVFPLDVTVLVSTCVCYSVSLPSGVTASDFDVEVSSHMPIVFSIFFNDNRSVTIKTIHHTYTRTRARAHTHTHIHTHTHMCTGRSERKHVKEFCFQVH